MLLRQLLPPRLRQFWFWHFIALRREVNPARFEAAELDFASGSRMKLLPSDIGHRQIAYLGYAERPLSARMVELGRKGGLLVDVGANYGYFTLLWSAQAAHNRVIAFEASPRNLPALEFNIERNQRQSAVTVVPKAVGAHPGRMAFDPGPAEQTGWGGLSAAPAAGLVEVEVITLDQYFAASDVSIDVLKIDVEGADTWVLEGARTLLSTKRIQNIFFEQNPDRMAALQIATDRAEILLQELGYRVSIHGGTGYAVPAS